MWVFHVDVSTTTRTALAKCKTAGTLGQSILCRVQCLEPDCDAGSTCSTGFTVLWFSLAVRFCCGSMPWHNVADPPCMACGVANTINVQRLSNCAVFVLQLPVQPEALQTDIMSASNPLLLAPIQVVWA